MMDGKEEGGVIRKAPNRKLIGPLCLFFSIALSLQLTLYSSLAAPVLCLENLTVDERKSPHYMKIRAFSVFFSLF
jgi:Flp pilus assembly protein protease CpaA